jgi:hypothetical protein
LKDVIHKWQVFFPDVSNTENMMNTRPIIEKSRPMRKFIFALFALFIIASVYRVMVSLEIKKNTFVNKDILRRSKQQKMQ